MLHDSLISCSLALLPLYTPLSCRWNNLDSLYYSTKVHPHIFIMDLHGHGFKNIFLKVPPSVFLAKWIWFKTDLNYMYLYMYYVK